MGSYYHFDAGFFTLFAQSSNNGIKQLPSDYNASSGVQRILNKPNLNIYATLTRVDFVLDSLRTTLNGVFVPYSGATANIDINSKQIQSTHLGWTLQLNGFQHSYTNGTYSSLYAGTSIGFSYSSGGNSDQYYLGYDGLYRLLNGKQVNLKIRNPQAANTKVYIPSPVAINDSLTLADSAKVLALTGGVITGSLTVVGTVAASNLTSASWSPTITNLGSFTSVTVTGVKYLRVANSVTVSGIMMCTGTVPGNLTMSIPFYTNFISIDEVDGLITRRSNTGVSAAGSSGVYANTGEATVKLYPPTAAANGESQRFQFTYLIH
jgi:hypothetical protein